MRTKLVTGIGLSTLLILALANPALAQEADAGVEAATEVQMILDNLWVLIAAALVFFMQAGFGLVEAGLTRAKNVANIMMKNLMDLSIGVAVFGIVGFGIAFGDGNDFFGTTGWLMNFKDYGMEAYADFGYSLNLSLPTFFVFQAAFAATAATIVSGAVAERTKFKAYIVYSIAITAVIYPVVVHWMWGGGWLAQRGFGDFAGSTLVHSTGGWAAMMGALILGPRIGKYGKDGKPRAIPGHSIPFAVVGVFILFIGWFGFNGGSELAADGAVPWIFATTLLAATFGTLGAVTTVWITSGKPDVAMAGNGMLAGLVSITAGTLTITPMLACLVGFIGGVVVVFAVYFFDRVAKIDDPVGAISVHGVCGAWGTLAVGLFSFQDDAFVGADRLGLFYGGGTELLVTQAIGVIAVFTFVTVASGLLFLGIKHTIGLRVDEEEEIAGLDVFEHGAPGYGPDILPGGSGVAGSTLTASTPVGVGR